MDTKTTFIYALCEPNSRTVRYIGKANCVTRRFKKHLNTSINNENHLGAWLRMLKSRREMPNLVILREVPFETWKEEEIRYISAAKILGMDLTNAVAGGGGCLRPSPESRRKMSESHIGKKLSAEHKAKIGLAGRGRSVSLETREKMSKAQTGRICSESTRARLSELNSNPSLESRAKSGAKNRGRKPSDEVRAAASVRVSGDKNPFFGKRHSLETRIKLAAAAKVRPGLKRTPETCAKMSESKRGANNPNFGQMASAEKRARMRAAQLLRRSKEKESRG